MLYLFLVAGLFLLPMLLRLAIRLRLGIPILYALGMLTVFHSWYQAHTALAACGAESRGQSTMAKAMAKAGIKGRTLMDHSTGALAQMLTEGSNQGVMDVVFIRMWGKRKRLSGFGEAALYRAALFAVSYRQNAAAIPRERKGNDP